MAKPQRKRIMRKSAPTSILGKIGPHLRGLPRGHDAKTAQELRGRLIAIRKEVAALQKPKKAA